MRSSFGCEPPRLFRVPTAVEEPAADRGRPRRPQPGSMRLNVDDPASSSSVSSSKRESHARRPRRLGSFHSSQSAYVPLAQTVRRAVRRAAAYGGARPASLDTTRRRERASRLRDGHRIAAQVRDEHAGRSVHARFGAWPVIPSSASGQQQRQREREPDDRAHASQGARERDREDGEVEHGEPAALPDGDPPAVATATTKNSELVPVRRWCLPLRDVAARRGCRRGACGSSGRASVPYGRGDGAGPGHDEVEEPPPGGVGDRTAERRSEDDQPRRGRRARRPSTTEPCTFAQSTSSGKTRSVRRFARSLVRCGEREGEREERERNRLGTQLPRPRSDDEADTVARSVIRTDAPRTREATIAMRDGAC